MIKENVEELIRYNKCLFLLNPKSNDYEDAIEEFSESLIKQINQLNGG